MLLFYEFGRLYTYLTTTHAVENIFFTMEISLGSLYHQSHSPMPSPITWLHINEIVQYVFFCVYLLFIIIIAPIHKTTLKIKLDNICIPPCQAHTKCLRSVIYVTVCSICVSSHSILIEDKFQKVAIITYFKEKC